MRNKIKKLFLLTSLFVGFFNYDLFCQSKTKKDNIKYDKNCIKDCKQHFISNKFIDKQMVALPDGSIVLLVGRKLMKFNSELKLIKEVEIKIDKEFYKGMMFKDDSFHEKGISVDEGIEDKSYFEQKNLEKEEKK